MERVDFRAVWYFKIHHVLAKGLVVNDVDHFNMLILFEAQKLHVSVVHIFLGRLHTLIVVMSFHCAISRVF